MYPRSLLDLSLLHQASCALVANETQPILGLCEGLYFFLCSPFLRQRLIYLRLILNSWTSCHHLPCTETTDLCHHAWPPGSVWLFQSSTDRTMVREFCPTSQSFLLEWLWNSMKFRVQSSSCLGPQTRSQNHWRAWKMIDSSWAGQTCIGNGHIPTRYTQALQTHTHMCMCTCMFSNKD